METWFRSCCVGVALLVASSSCCRSAAAQVLVNGTGMSVRGVGHSHHGGASSSVVVESYSVTPGFAAGVVQPYYVGWGGLPYSSPFGGYGGYGGYVAPWVGGPWGGGPWYPPVVVPAEWFYGPSAAQPIVGTNGWSNSSSVKQTTIVMPAASQPVAKPGNGFGANAPANPNQVPPPPMNLAPTNAPTQQRARKIVDSGDAAFARQQFADALAKYKDAARAAPDLAETYFRQAAADMALQRYDDAASAIKLGLRLQPTWVDAPFRFSALYGAADLVRRQHVDALWQAATDRPTSDLLFLCGVVSFFDEGPQQAEPLFTRAAALAIGETWHIGLFQEASKRRMPAAPQPVEAAQPAAAGARDI